MENVKTQDAVKSSGSITKIINFFKEYYGFFIIPIFISFVFGMALYKFDIWPFGTAIIASYDMLAQVCPIIEHFFDVFDGTSGIFHTFHLGGGMDMFGILAYCAVSPFTFLLLLGGQGYTVYMVSIVLPIKIICIAISAFLFLRKYFKCLPQYIQIVLALLYAYSGYMYVANTYIIWMDLMMYMPLVGAGIIKFSKTKSIKLLVVSVTIMIYTCFSIVCFSLLTLFPILVCYVIICKRKTEWAEYLSKLCLAFVVAVGASLPVLIPSLVAYMQAGRNTGLFSRVFEILSQEKVKEGELNIHIYEKFTYILTDSVFVFLTIVYFLQSKKGDKRALFLLVAFLFLLLPCLIDESMLLLNMGSYYSYALRFGFLSSFFFLYVSALALKEFLESKNADCQVEKIKSAISQVLTALLVIAGVLFTFAFFNYILEGKYENDPLILKLFGSDSETAPFKDFFPLFAHSEGGLEATGVLFGVVMIILIIVTVFIKFKFVKFKDVVCFICVLAISQTVFFNFSLVKGNKQSTSAQKFDYYKQMISSLEDEDVYRVKSYDYYISSDSPLIIGCYSHTLFSSMADAKNITAPKFFGYGGSLTNSTRSNRGSVFSDALLSYKYVVYSAGNKSTAESKSYLQYTGISAHKQPSVKVSTTDNGSTITNKWENVDSAVYGQNKWIRLKIEIKGNKFTGYYNGNKFLSINMSSSEILAVTATTKNAYGEIKNISVKDNSGHEISGTWAENSGFEKNNDVYKSIDYNGKITFTGQLDNISSFEADVLFSQGTASDDYIGLEVSTKKANTSEKASYRLIIEPNVEYFLYENTYSFPMASVIDGGELDFDATNKSDTYYNLTKLLYGEQLISNGTTTVSNEKIQQLRDKLKAGEVKHTLIKNRIVLEKFTAKSGQLLYLNYVNLKGYKAYVNGKEKPLLQNGLDFMFVELDEGENTVEIVYKSPYKSFILIGMLLAGLILACCWLVVKTKPIIFEKLSVVLPYAGVALAIGLTLFFFIFPTGVYFYKLIFKYSKFLF